MKSLLRGYYIFHGLGHNMAVGTHIIESKETVSVLIRINTAAGVVDINAPIKCLVMEAHEDEFIVGSDLLWSLGIDVDHQLEQLAQRPGDNDGTTTSILLVVQQQTKQLTKPSSISLKMH